MDHYGIGAAITGAMNIYLQTARQTGRTTSLVDSLKSGDRVIFTDSREAQRVQRLIAQRGINVECLIVNPDNPHALFDRGSVPGEGRLVFDHRWVEEYYRLAIARAMKDIDHFERELSGYGAAHRETRQRAIELSKWHQWLE